MDLRTKQYFEGHASQFDSLYHAGRPLRRSFNRTFRRAIYERFAITFREAEPIAGRSILDVGCGSGRYAVEFARQGAARVVGIDYAAQMLELARNYAYSEGVSHLCDFLQADFTNFTLNEQFDVVIAIGVFDYQGQPVEFLRRMVQHCRGRIIATFPGHSVVRMRIRQLRYWLKNCPVRFYTEQGVRETAERAGIGAMRIIRIASSGTGFVLVGDV